MKVINFKTLCNHITKSVIWNSQPVDAGTKAERISRWESDDGAVLTISECPDYELNFVTYKPAQTAKEPSPKRGYLTDHEMNYVRGLLSRRQSGSPIDNWPLSITTEMRGGDRYASITTTYEVSAQEGTWKHQVTALPGADKSTIQYQCESYGKEGLKLHNTLVTRIYKQIIGKQE